MSSDESETSPHHKRKRKIRRLPDDSPASTSSGSPIIGNSSNRRRRVAIIQEQSSDSDSSDNSGVLKRKKTSRVLQDRIDSSSSSEGILACRKTKNRAAIIGSDSDVSSLSSGSLIAPRRNRNAVAFTDTENDDSHWESDYSDSGHEVPTKTNKPTTSVSEEKDLNSDSSDGQSEKCPICLISFRLQEVGIPENCEHSFCLECIQEWSKNMNTCPVDRKEYSSITVKQSFEGKVLRKIPIEKPQAQNEVDIVEDPTFCEICGSNDNEDRLLLCDGCDLGFHLYCLTPPLNEVPEGAWFCNECSPNDQMDSDIDLEEIARLYDDVSDIFSGVQNIWGQRRQQRSTRLVPRTRQTERVRRRIANNRSLRQQNRTLHDEMPSTSSGISDLNSSRVSSTTGFKKPKKSKSGRKKTKKSFRPSQYRTVYVIDEVTGEAVPVKKKVKSKRRKFRRKGRKSRSSTASATHKTVKKRLAAQLGICAPRSIPQNLPDVKIQNNSGGIQEQRAHAGIPRLDIFGRVDRLDYFSQSEDEGIYNEGDGVHTSLLTRRAPNVSDIRALRRAARRKAAIRVPQVVSSTTDILASIMDSQEKFLSKHAVISVVDSSGKLRIEQKMNQPNINNNTSPTNLNSYKVRQRPTYGGRNNSGSHSNQNWSSTSNNYHSMGNQPYYSVPSSTYESNSSNLSGNVEESGQNNDVPQDYTQRTLCEAQMLQEAEDKDKYTPGSNTPISEDDLDIYSDMENESVSTSKYEDLKPPSPPNMMQVQSHTPNTNTDEDNDSESGMVIDTEKVQEENKEEPVTSTVGYCTDTPYSPGQPTYSPGQITYSPGQPTDDAPTEVSSIASPLSEIQSEAVQSSQNKIDEDLEEECPNISIYNTKELNSEKNYDDEDSNDGCPNFSIYSRESKTVALTTDISLPPPDVNDPQVEEVSSVENPQTENMFTDNCESENEKPNSTELPNEPTVNFQKTLGQGSDPRLRVPLVTAWSMGGLYSDSEDETVVKKTTNSFVITDIKDMTEDILSEEERSYTPCLDEKSEKPKEGLEGLDTELISDEDRNDFDESHELKTVSDGDALEINAKESELDFTRPEDYEEGEIVDKNKEKTSEEHKESTPERNIEKDKDKDKDKKKKDDKDSKKKKKDKDKNKDTSSKDAEKSGNKENESKESSFKKLSKNSKERNYRDKEKERGRSRSKSPGKMTNKEKEKREDARRKKEKRKEIQRYNVRALIAVKPRPPPKDKFGRDLRRTPSKSKSKSRSRSYTPPIIHKSPCRGGSVPQRKSRSVSRAPTPRAKRSMSKRRSVSKDKGKRKPRSRNRRSVSRSKSRSRSAGRRRDRSKNRKRKRSPSKGDRKRRSKDESKSKKRAKTKSRSRSRVRSHSRSLSPRRRRRDWTPSFSRSPTSQMHHMSPSWTPPRLDNSQALRNQNLTVILNNDAAKKKKEKKRLKEKKKDGQSSKKRRRERERTPPPSKEVFASGDNILVSVSFNNENETRDITTRERRRKEVERAERAEEQPKKRRERRIRTNKKDLSGVKPVAIIDLERSPFQEIGPSPKDIIVLSDSDNNENENRNIQNDICDSSQQVASPERIPAYTTGPKTPPEPQVKFSLLPKPQQLRAITNPLHEPDDITEDDVQEEINNTIHKGPNTPPEEPPTSPPSSPDAYDPFEPTKSRSATPEPNQTLQSGTGNDTNREDNMESRSTLDLLEKSAQTPDIIKSLTPPVAEIQPADSQSSIHETPEPKSPDQRIGVVINQILQPVISKPVGQTTPFSSVPTSMITSTPVSSNLASSRINILNSTLVTPPSSIPQRIVLPNQIKSSPVKISPTKATVKSTPIKPMQSKANNKTPIKKGNRTQNGSNMDDANLDFDSPYSPGSSDYEDLFEPPTETVSKPKSLPKSKTTTSQKHQSTFDVLFGSPIFNKKKAEKGKFGGKKNVSPTKTKQVGVKVDEDSLKILEELPNSAVEMQVKDKFLKKLNRQERVVEEVKLVLKPFYNKKKISKGEYKDIMRRAVPKICHNKSGEINPIKIRGLIEAYVKKIKHSKKVTSSSSLPQKA